jgi:hypothetical protein
MKSLSNGLYQINFIISQLEPVYIITLHKLDPVTEKWISVKCTPMETTI